MIWSLISGIGSLVGLATGLFVVWDRFNQAPTAIVISRPLAPGSVTKALCLRVQNRSPRPIFVSWESGLKDGQLGIAEGHDIRQVLLGIVEGLRTTVIDPNEAHEFVLLAPPNQAAIDPDNWVEARLRWRYAQPIFWQGDRRLTVKIPMQSLILLDSTYEDEND